MTTLFGNIKVSKIFDCYKGLPKSMYFLFLARTINSMGDFAFPLLTMYLTQKLASGEEKAGLYLMLASLAAAPGTLLGGYLADKVSRKTMIIIPQILALGCFILCAFIGKSFNIVVLLILSIFFISITRPSYQALIVDLTHSNNRKSAFTLMYLGVNIGACIGPMVAGFFFNNYIMWVFIGIGVTTLISLLIVFRYIKAPNLITENNGENPDILANKNEEAEDGNLFVTLMKRPFLLAFVFLSFIIFFIYIQYSFSMPIYTNHVFGNNGAKIFGSLMTVNALGVIFLTSIVATLTKKILPILNIAIGGIFFAFGFGMLFYVTHFYLFVLSTLIWTIGEILLQPNLNVHIANNTPISHRGRFNALLLLVRVLGSAAGPSIMGFCMKFYGVRTVWLIIFFLGIGFTAVMYLIHILETKSKGILLKEKQPEDYKLS